MLCHSFPEISHRHLCFATKFTIGIFQLLNPTMATTNTTITQQHYYPSPHSNQALFADPLIKLMKQSQISEPDDSSCLLSISGMGSSLSAAGV